MMKDKAEAPKLLKHFVKTIKTQFGLTQKITSENASEYVYGSLKRIVFEKGMLLHTSCTHTPQ